MGYKKKITPEQLIKGQIVNHLNEISKIGESRHEAKRVGDASPFIFSIKTYEAYKETMNTFVDYCLTHHPQVKNVYECKLYVEEYIKHIIDKGYSSYTQKSRLAGFRKFYNDRFEGIYTESRKRSQIKRGRSDTAHSRHFSEEANGTLIHFCKCTGLRRSELEHLKGGCVSLHHDGHYYINNVKGKGGRVRDIRILNDDKEVIDKIQNTAPNELV